MNAQHRRFVVDDIGGLMPNIRLDKMTTADIDTFLERLQQRSRSARIYGLTYLKAILNDAKFRQKITISPADGYRIPARVERERVLKISEIQRFLEACHDMADQHADVI